MNEVSKVEIPVEAATAAALSDARRREAVGRLVDRLVRPGADDPLIALFERTAAEARKAGLNDSEIGADSRFTTRSAAPERLRVRREHCRFGCPQPWQGTPTRPGHRAVKRHSGPVGGGVPGDRRGFGEAKVRARVDQDRRREALELLSAAALWVEPTVAVQDCRDSKDNRYLELALAAGATAIVSGDHDLLAMHPWRGIQVLGLPAFLTAAGMDSPKP